MTDIGFAHLWQSQWLSDMQITLFVDDESLKAADAAPEARFRVLQQIPAHSQIMTQSSYIRTKMQFPVPAGSGGNSQSCMASSIAGSSSKRQAKESVNLDLPDATFGPAAIAVLQGMYQAQPWPKLLADLTPQQQVHAAILADRWGVAAALSEAVGFLTAAADSADEVRMGAMLEGLFTVVVPDSLEPVLDHAWQALVDKFGSMPAVPDSVLRVFETGLLRKYGDLEAVWSPDNGELQRSLLSLPLTTMELFLSLDELKVDSEDTVLFTVCTYINKIAAGGPGSGVGDTQPALDKLSPLVRCPHLSQLRLSAALLSDDNSMLLLRELQPQLKRLQLLKSSCSIDVDLGCEDIEKHVPNVPASWLLPVRDIQPTSSAQLDWEVDVAAIRQAAQDSASQKRTTILMSPTSCLLGGLTWGMDLRCDWQASKQGSKIGVFVHARNLPAGSLCRCTYSLEIVDIQAGCTPGSRFFNNNPWGYFNFFRVGFMSGVFDEAAWIEKGLPTSGSIKLRLTVSNVAE